MNLIPASKEWGFFSTCHCALSKAISFSLPVLCRTIEFLLITKIGFLSQQKGCCIVSLINLNSLMFIIYTRRDRSRPVLFKFNETIKKLRKIIFQASSGRCCPYQPHTVRTFPSIIKIDFLFNRKAVVQFKPQRL